MLKNPKRTNVLATEVANKTNEIGEHLSESENRTENFRSVLFGVLESLEERLNGKFDEIGERLEERLNEIEDKVDESIDALIAAKNKNALDDIELSFWKKEVRREFKNILSKVQ